ncbi:Kinesin domain-containing protein/Kinesin-relat_1 domain-containing protein [Cephalotus follicularis]|uniref:Kinesin domain-containing protein/Kinesin-relat_1 domain-containing protein n=1 Tax=Cephalotus follicularis TaxID=3775 RepID=A0A1Q3CMM4_CEPFO|nr:Kinesin domain-containing protein/Kinesin-relat_1 domain-containing protein [Cephalotus follicularis]
MLRDFNILRRNLDSVKNDEIENVPINPGDSLVSQSTIDSSRAPLHTIQDPIQYPKPKYEEESTTGIRSIIERTPTKPKTKATDSSSLPIRTPDNKHGTGFLSKARFGWTQRNDQMLNPASDDNPLQACRGVGTTPRSSKAVVGRTVSGYSESSSTQNTPTKSVSKPPNSGFRSRVDGNGGARAGGFAALYKGNPSNCGLVTSTVVNTVEVPHFDLKEDPSFWMDHNVQVLIRVRPLNGMEKGMHGYNRCLKQESAQSITWIGQPESRFTFDHVACETVDQEMIFRMAGLQMVENCLSGYNSCMFAYGQTGSGKTYTMLGEIEDLELKPSPHRGMTPRIFEFLFARIQAEEESRRDEKLKYNCKCSFLEIYNEQITDLLDPSSTNLLLREDVKKGVYVENLSEFEVWTVSDILRLLMQGSLNRKVGATNMNRESSRSHCVFTCVIESRWENDSTTNLRFARLNLVDLAGSERQKTSGAEGERLKEAANINKSLSTLGHVIMLLVDVAHGKPRHVPYRDSRLTFLLQDSLGGNSKTMIIANVSPSICCASETLNTLKFAQRAKLIQNNAVVNEDSTGDVIALQHQIRLLNEELSILKRQNVSRSLSFVSTSNTMNIEENACIEDKYEISQKQTVDLLGDESKGIVRMSTKQLKSLEATLAGSLRREQMAETSIKKLEAEIEQLNRLVRQREEDTRSTKMMLRFREDKILRMESLLGGSLPPESFLLEENRLLTEEIQLLQSKIDKNPEVTRFALENIRLLDQLRRYQEIYEEGEREILLAEISKLRDQLMQCLNGNLMQYNANNFNLQQQEATRISKENNFNNLELINTLNELEECRHNLNSCLEDNAKLSRELQDLQYTLNNLKASPRDKGGNVKTLKDASGFLPNEVAQNEAVRGTHATPSMKHAEEFMDWQLELDILKIILKEERSSRGEIEERAMQLERDLEVTKENLMLLREQCKGTDGELKEAKSVIEALESQHILLINEIEDQKRTNSHYLKLLSEHGLENIALKEQLSNKELKNHPPSDHLDSEDSKLQAKLKKIQDSLEKARRLNLCYQSDRAFQVSSEEEMDEVRRQAEAETAEVIVCMQEELAILHQQVQDGHLKEMDGKKNLMHLETELKEMQENLCLLNEDNKWLRGKLEEKDGELRILSEEWELLTCEIEDILEDGHEALLDASDQLDLISSSFPQKRIWISEQVCKLIRILSEKDLVIEELGRCLEDAFNKKSDVECMLKSLRGAALVINEAHQQECNEKENEIFRLMSQLSEKASFIEKLEDQMKLAEHLIVETSNCATIAFVIVNRFSEINFDNLNALKHKDIQLRESAEMNLRKDALLDDQAVVIEEAEKQIHSLRWELKELEKSCTELEQKLYEEELRAFFMERKLDEIEENDIMNTRKKLSELKTGVSTLRSCMNMSPENSSGERQPDIEMNQEDKDFKFVEDPRTYISSSLLGGKNIHGISDDQKHMEPKKTCYNVRHKDVTIILLKKEIESALESLKEVQAEMAKLRNEKEEIWVSKKRSEEDMKCVTNELLALQESISNFEKQSELKIEAVNHKLQMFEQIVQDAGSYWCQTKEFLELEVGEAKMIAAQRTAEASCIIAKFSEAQDTMKEADIMINGLMIANETMKIDIGRLKQMKVELMSERDILVDEVQRLRSVNAKKDCQLEDLEKQFGSSLMETRDLVSELEGIFAEMRITFEKNFMPIASELHLMKSLFFDSTMLVRSWLEDVWSGIIVKDCAVSVLHLCHMGIVLETVTGLYAENGLLQHGLCQSNSAIADLREHNYKSRRELEMCRILKGKLLADIKNSFDRILRKEEETGELTCKLITFEKNISDLQLQEELMLQRSHYMGSQLAVLMREVDFSNSKVVLSLLDQAKLLKDKEDDLRSQAEFLMIDLYSKDIQSFIFALELEDMALQKTDVERENFYCFAVIENLKKELIFANLDMELTKQFLEDRKTEATTLQEEVVEVQSERHILLSELNQSVQKVSQLDEVNKALEHDIQLLKDVAYSNDRLKGELREVKEINVKQLNRVQALEAECEKLLQDLKARETELEHSSSHISAIDQGNEKLQKEICYLEASSCKLQNELDLKDVQLSRMICLEEENNFLKSELTKLETEKSWVLQDLEETKSKFELALSHIDTSDMETNRLQDKIFSLETCIGSLQTDLQSKNAELNEIQHSESVVMEDLRSKSQDLQIYVNRVNALKQENISLGNELRSLEKDKHKALTMSSLNIVKCVDSVETLHSKGSRIFNKLNDSSLKIADKVFEDMCENLERTSKFMEDIQFLECQAKEMVTENMTLQAELSRKDDVLKGLLFDLSLLQESASNIKDQKDDIEEMVASFETLEEELAVKSGELHDAVSHSQMLETQLQEKIDVISTLELDISKERATLKLLSCENSELRAHIEEILVQKCALEEKFTKRSEMTENLEMELLEMGTALGQLNDTVESLRRNLDELNGEKDHFKVEVLSLRQKLEKAEARAVENEAIAMEAQQIADSRKMYAEAKESEVKLLERSVEELEFTVNVLENKVDIIKGEAERQCLQREEIELELHHVNQQMQNVKNADADMKRHLDEKEKDLHQALKHIHILERDIADKNVEISQFKAHVSELNLHAEAQASEYKQKFKALEAMAEQVRPEGHFSHTANSSSDKLEKNAGKSSRGSGSPFKCIGIGLTQQMKSEKDEELVVARSRIEDLESLAISRQKEIFALNARLAAAESMTHDVIRDLLGVKLDMTNYVSMLDNQQLQKITEKARVNGLESQVKEQEVVKLKQQLNEFIEERQGWLEEIEHKQAEMVAAQIALEKLRQRYHLLQAECEMLKMENVNHKKKVMELESEAKKLSGQQNLQQRIHHHAKIKEENNKLKNQNEELNTQLRREKAILQRLKDELAHYRASHGRSSYVSFEEDQYKV